MARYFRVQSVPHRFSMCPLVRSDQVPVRRRNLRSNYIKTPIACYNHCRRGHLSASVRLFHDLFFDECFMGLAEQFADCTICECPVDENPTLPGTNVYNLSLAMASLTLQPLDELCESLAGLTLYAETDIKLLVDLMAKLHLDDLDEESSSADEACIDLTLQKSDRDALEDMLPEHQSCYLYTSLDSPMLSPSLTPEQGDLSATTRGSESQAPVLVDNLKPTYSQEEITHAEVVALPDSDVSLHALMTSVPDRLYLNRLLPLFRTFSSTIRTSGRTWTSSLHRLLPSTPSPIRVASLICPPFLEQVLASVSEEDFTLDVD